MPIFVFDVEEIHTKHCTYRVEAQSPEDARDMIEDDDLDGSEDVVERSTIVERTITHEHGEEADEEEPEEADEEEPEEADEEEPEEAADADA